MRSIEAALPREFQVSSRPTTETSSRSSTTQVVVKSPDLRNTIRHEMQHALVGEYLGIPVQKTSARANYQAGYKGVTYFGSGSLEAFKIAAMAGGAHNREGGQSDEAKAAMIFNQAGGLTPEGARETAKTIISFKTPEQWEKAIDVFGGEHANEVTGSIMPVFQRADQLIAEEKQQKADKEREENTRVVIDDQGGDQVHVAKYVFDKLEKAADVCLICKQANSHASWCNAVNPQTKPADQLPAIAANEPRAVPLSFEAAKPARHSFYIPDTKTA